MSTYISDDKRLSATGRGKRQDGVTEHNLTYTFEPGTGNPTVEFRGRRPQYSEGTLDTIQSVVEEDDSGPGSIGWTDIQ